MFKRCLSISPSIHVFIYPPICSPVCPFMHPFIPLAAVCSETCLPNTHSHLGLAQELSQTPDYQKPPSSRFRPVNREVTAHCERRNDGSTQRNRGDTEKVMVPSGWIWGSLPVEVTSELQTGKNPVTSIQPRIMLTVQ